MFQAVGPLSAQMLGHILLMNGVAPALVLIASRTPLSPSRFTRKHLLFPAMLLQLGVLWGWHVPSALDAAMRSDALHFVMQASLLVCALLFWWAVFFNRPDHQWRPILALLLTSKVFCLLGVLLVFAPRTLYSSVLTGQRHGMAHAASALEDQQLAGLFMLVACPLTYLIAGIVIAARWLARIDAAGHASLPCQNPRHAA